jgi:putative ABC transport system substrate-binding protein
MKRREFISALGGAAASSALWPLGARAQQSERMRRIGVVIIPDENEPAGRQYFFAVRNSLAELGWIEGRNIRIDYRFGAGNPDRAEAAAKDLVAISPDVIMVQGTPGTAALKKATKTIPLVFNSVTDPVGAGFVESLARPGGNITGFSTFEPEIGGKWLQLLKEISPNLRRVAGIVDLPFAAFTKLWRATESAAPSMNLETTTIGFHRRSDDLESAIASFANRPEGALVVLPTAINNLDRSRIFSLATRYRLPAIYAFTHYTAAGGLMTYGLDNLRAFTSGLAYVDRILKGAKPADLPVQAPTKFELVINLKTAKTIGLDVAPSLLARADEVIE